MSYTKGPWMAGKTKKGPGQAETEVFAHDAPPGQKLPATCWGENSKANARLVSAAPELLEALEKIISTLFLECQPDRGDLFSKIDDIARPVIKKARGPQ